MTTKWIILMSLLIMFMSLNRLIHGITETELLLYHNSAAFLDEYLQNEAQEFGFTEVVMAALRGNMKAILYGQAIPKMLRYKYL